MFSAFLMTIKLRVVSAMNLRRKRSEFEKNYNFGNAMQK